MKNLPEQFQIPRKYEDGKIICDSRGKVVAAGFLKVTAELLIAVNRSAPTVQRAKALRELISAGIYKGQQLGLIDMYAFLTGDKQAEMSKILQRKFGFVERNDQALVLNL